MPHLFVNRPRLHDIIGTDPSLKDEFRWETINAVVYKLGGVVFIIGSILFFPALSDYADIGAWAFIVGSLLYLLVTGHDMAEVIRQMRTERGAATFWQMLEFIAAESPEVLNDVKAFILTFKDIPERVPANAIAKVVREVEVDVFLKAAKYGKQNAPEAVEFIFKNISQRMGQQYEEQMGEMKPFTLAEAEAAQAQIMTALRRLVAAGEFELNKIDTGEVDEEVYV